MSTDSNNLNNLQTDADLVDFSKGINKPKHNVAKNVGTGMQVAGKGTRIAGTGAKAVGTGAEYVGKGTSKAGKSMIKSGVNMSGTGLGAIVGVPLAALGAATTVAGEGARAAGVASKKIGSATEKVGEKVDNAGKNIRETSAEEESVDSANKKAIGIAKKINKTVAVVKILILFAIFLFILLFIVVIFVPVAYVLGILDFGGISNPSSGSISESAYLQSANRDCSGGIIVNEQVYDLEDYVAGVVTAEADPNQDMEALKAQAIAARTYAIVRTNHCKNSISNSSRDQNFNVNASDKAKQAVNETRGMVLTYDSTMFLSEYDSFYGKKEDCDSNGCSASYKKLPNGESNNIVLSNKYKFLIAGGHGRGMSQVYSYELADSGKNYEEILKFFYSSGVKISALNTQDYSSGLSAKSPVTGISTRVGAPSMNNKHDAHFYYSNYNLSYSAGFVGQCTWYSYGRANEILDEVGSSLKWKYAPDAKEWYTFNLSDSEPFSSSTDVNSPKVGAIIVWNGGKHGHVAVVEAVNDDGTIDYSEGNIDTVRNAATNPYGFRYQSHIPLSGGHGTISNIWTGYSFVGYIYMLE